MQLARIAAAIGTLLCLAGAAEAYPQFQLTTGNGRCSSCHLSPSGGGLLNSWGRDESADTIAMGDSESFLGDPRPLNGLWEPPDWWQFGGDYRGAGILKDAPDQEPEFLGFPMQADLYNNFQIGDVSIGLTVGARGAARDNSRPPVSERIVSREHFVMWRPKTTGPYAKLGRYFPIYGLRLVDHTSYTRRRLGFHILEEPYTLSAGTVSEGSELHGSLYAASPVFAAGRRATGGAVYYEKRIARSRGAVGAQSKLDMTGEDIRFLAGGVGKYWLEGSKLLLLGQVDAGFQRFRTSGPTIGQLSVHASATYIPKMWLMFGLALERYDNDLRLERSGRDAASLTVQFFPRAHWELVLMGKIEAQGEAYDRPNGFGMFMLHYWL